LTREPARGESFAHRGRVLIYLLEFPFMAAVVDAEKCHACGECVQSCPLDAITMKETVAYIDPEVCGDCGACVDVCPKEAISV
jgi:heterodisulfide reductase subunit A-like polyferredoxin